MMQTCMVLVVLHDEARDACMEVQACLLHLHGAHLVGCTRYR